MNKYEPNKIPLHVRGENPDMLIPETPVPEKEPEPWEDTKIVGQSMPRVDAYERVSGSAQYTYDVFLPGMLYGACLRSPLAHAKITSIDTSAAEKMPGVHTVLSSKSKIADIAMMGGRSKLFDTHCRFEGDEVAAVAAESPYIAWEALQAIKVEFEELPFALDEKSATAPGGPVILKDEGAGRRRSIGPNNTVVDEGGSSSRGDIGKGFAEADQIVELSFHNDCVIHVPLEVHGSVAQWNGDKLKLWDSAQGVFNMMHGVASALKIPISNIEVIGDYVGGGFGAKLGIWKHQVMAALLAKVTAKPVKMMLRREEAFMCVGNRPRTDATVKAGAKSDGTITAIEHTGSSTGGAFPYTNTTGFQSGELYLCENFKQDEHFYLTNAGMGCAMRAPGFPNGNFMTEQVIDELALKINMDPVEFRIKNVPDFSQRDDRKRPYTSTGLADCLRDGAKAFGWKDARSRSGGDGHIKTGAGVAGGLWGYGGGWPPATIILKMYMDGSVAIITGASDIGTGTKTILTMIIAEELGMPIERIRIENADTANTPFASASGGSKTLPTEGPAARTAAFDLKNKLIELAAGHLNVSEDDLILKNETISSTTDESKSITTSNLLRRTLRFDVIGVGYRKPNVEDKIIRTWGAHFAEVSVNTLTGKVSVNRMVGVNESGRVINRLTFNNQVYGGMTMAMGQALSEQRIMDSGQTGKIVNTNWLDYKLPTSKDVPHDHDILAVEPVDVECNNLGAKGLGEPAMIPTMAAIANAIYDAIGVRVTNTPITPIQIMKLLAEKRG